MKNRKQSRTGILPVYRRAALRVQTGWKPILLSCLVVAVSGCKEQAKEPGSFTDPVYSRQYREKSAIAIVTLSETNVATSGKIQLMIEVHAEKSADIIFPDLQTTIEQLTVADGYTEPLQTLPNGQVLTRRAWTLLPALPGGYELPALQISAGSTRFETVPVALTITSLLPEGIEDFQIRDIAPVALQLPGREKKQKAVVIVLSTFFGLALLIIFLRKLLRKKPDKEIPCHEQALMAMNQLPEDPVERIHRLVRILQTYMESRFTLPLAGKTLPELRTLLTGKQFAEVVPFLETSEQIRFSNQVPPGFADESEQFVRHFIEVTREELCD